MSAPTGQVRAGAVFALAGLLGLTGGQAAAQEAVRLQERFPVGYQYSVRSRSDGTSSLTLPAVKGKPAPKPVLVRGDTASEYDERILEVTGKGEVSKTVRSCKRMEVRRTAAGQPQQASLRPAVRRLVLLRRDNAAVPFSPDGPLTWGEIDLVRADTFTPLLVGLLPDRPVRVGERWQAATEALRALVDLEKIEAGALECRLLRVEVVGGRRQARVAFEGTLRGINQDGRSSQRVVGSYVFDLESNHLSALQVNGTASMLDKDGKEVGRQEGRFALERRVNARSPDLTDAALRGLALEPNADNTRLLYDNPDLGVRFLHPRRWRVGVVQGVQLALDGADGSGLLLTLEPLARVPTGATFLAESRAWLEKQKARLLRQEAPRRLTATLEQFALEAEMGGQAFFMDYYVSRQALGGATVAARLPMRDLETLRREVEGIARSVVVTRRVTEGK